MVSPDPRAAGLGPRGPVETDPQVDTQGQVETAGDAVETARRAGPDPQVLARQVRELRGEMRRRHVGAEDALASVHPHHRRSAANLLDYLTLRGHDVRDLQDGLAELGLSSLGRAEEHVMTTIERVLATLDLLGGQHDGRWTEAAIGYGEGRRVLEGNADRLLGPVPTGRNTRIMVTLPTEAAWDERLVATLVAGGMDVARVNAAHDHPDCWQAMVRQVRQASSEVGRRIPVLVDLPGPKIRTGPVAPGPPVVRIRPRRDAWGRATAAARVVLVPDDRPTGPPPGPAGPGPSSAGVLVPVTAPWLEQRRVGDRIDLRDTRGSHRTLTVTAVGADEVVVDVPDTTYLASGVQLVASPGTWSTLATGDASAAPTPVATVGALPPVEQWLVLRPGDVLTLTADQAPAVPATTVGLDGDSGAPGEATRQRMACTSAAALAKVAVGHRVFFDDGRIGGVAVAQRPGEVDVRIVRARDSGSRLRAEKGINLPDTDLVLPQYTEADDEALHFAAAHADLLGLSFVQRPADVLTVQRRLAGLGATELGLVLKIETARGFEGLPDLLLAAMASERVGVMIARGDLAVECGFERLAEQQEEMLALCDAAHVPVVWATEVLDRLARTGRPTRAEVSDAAMGGRAECVMLNKGPHIAEALATLDDILRRMSGHQRKKVTLLRRLRSWSTDGHGTEPA